MTTPQSRDEFLAAPRTAVLATVDARGRPHAVAVWYLWKDGRFSIVTDRGSQKHLNAARSGRASLTVIDGPRYVTAEGPIRVQDPLTKDQRLELHTHYRGPEAAARIVADDAHERMVLLVLTPERWLGRG